MVAPKNLLSTLLAPGFGQPLQNPLGHLESGLSAAPQTGNIPYTLATERTFLLNVPEAYSHGDPHPLVLSFHGGESLPAMMPASRLRSH